MKATKSVTVLWLGERVVFEGDPGEALAWVAKLTAHGGSIRVSTKEVGLSMAELVEAFREENRRLTRELD